MTNIEREQRFFSLARKLVELQNAFHGAEVQEAVNAVKEQVDLLERELAAWQGELDKQAEDLHYFFSVFTGEICPTVQPIAERIERNP